MAKCKAKNCEWTVMNHFYCSRHEAELERLVRDQGRDFGGKYFHKGRWIYEWSRDPIETRLAMSTKKGFHIP